jgi:putative hemolysin
MGDVIGIEKRPRRLAVRLARDAADLAAVQHLRWQVFFDEMGARAQGLLDQLDADPYDALCDHLLVIDEDQPGTLVADGAVVGTYRLLRESIARAAQGFYSAGEFDLAPLMAGEGRVGGELLELGRSCVLPAFRTSATISLLWRGIADYIAAHDIGLMFGCASFPGIDPDAHAPALSLLAHTCLAPAAQRRRCAPTPAAPWRSNACRAAAMTNAARCWPCRR